MSVTIKLTQVCLGTRKFTCRRIPHNLNHKMHPLARHRWNKAWQEEVGNAFLLVRNKFGKLPLPKADIIIYFFSIQEIDKDNMFTASKPLIDVLKIKISKNNLGLGIIIDDKQKYCNWEVRWIKVKSKQEEHVEIEIN